MSDGAMYVARAGDALDRIARDHSSTVEAIWHHPRNARHVALRQDPGVLMAGDEVFLPRVDLAEVAVAPTERPPRRAPPTEPAPPADGWPYEPSSLTKPDVLPTWECPDGTCVCHRVEDGAVELVRHTVFLFDEQSRRMPHARCRVIRRGRPIDGADQARASGAVSFHAHPRDVSVWIEWAPSETPALPSLPFRRLYHLCLDAGEEGVRRRLEHVGVLHRGSLEERIAAFQRAYDLPVDGRVESVEGPLTAYHDTGSLPPLSRGGPPRSPVAPAAPVPNQGSVSGVEDYQVCHLSYRLFRSVGQAVAGVPFIVEIGWGRVLRGTTDATGGFEYGDVAPGDYALEVEGVIMRVPALPKDVRRRPLLVRIDR